MTAKIYLQVSLLCLAFSITKASSEKPVCTTESVTRKCEFFREHQSEAEIKLPDGTFFKNPLFKAAKLPKQGMMGESFGGAGGGFGSGTSGPYGGGGGYGPYGAGGYGPGVGGMGANLEEMQKLQEQYLADQAQVLEILEGTPLPVRTRLYLSTNGASLVGNNPYPVSAPSSLTSKEAKFQQQPASQVLEGLKKNLDPQKYAQLVNIWSQKNAQMYAFVENQRKQYSDEMARQQAEAAANTLKNQKRAARVQELFEFARTQVINAIKNGVEESKLDPARQKMIKKIEEIQMTKMDDPNLATQKTCQGNGNAFYSPAENTINLCPVWMFKTDANLVKVLAHEIGHSVDPCLFQMEEWDVDQTKLKEFIKAGDPNSYDINSLDANLAGDNSTFHSSLDFIVSDPGLQRRLIDYGAIKPRRPFTPFSEYPFTKEFKCQVEENKFKPTTAADQATTLKYMKGMLSDKVPPALAKASLERFKVVSEKYPQCLGSVTHNSQMGEVMSDAFGGYALEAYIQENPLQSEAEKVGALPESHSMCKRLGKDSKPGKYLPPQHLMGMIPRSRDEHPENDRRVERVMLSRPALASLFGCKPAGKNCFIGVPAKARNSNSKTTQEQGVK